MCLKIRCILESSPMLRDEKVNDPLSSLQSVLIILKQLTFVLNYSGADVVVSSERRRRSREIWPLDGWGNCQILSRAVREVINPTFPFNLSNQLENHLRCHLQVWTWNPPLFEVKGKWSFDTVKACDATQVTTADLCFARALSQFSQYCPRSIYFSFSSWYSMWGWSYTLWLLVILPPQSRRFRQELQSFQFCELCLGTVIISSRPGISPSAVLVKGLRERLRMGSWIFSVKTVLIRSPNMET